MKEGAQILGQLMPGKSGRQAGRQAGGRAGGRAGGQAGSQAKQADSRAAGAALDIGGSKLAQGTSLTRKRSCSFSKVMEAWMLAVMASTGEM